ncbi:MAG: hypothetical protein JNK25_08545 [Phycisphaerae bacterium]|nr:hypothetical protein [Phycisphaerae bacterium]
MMPSPASAATLMATIALAACAPSPMINANKSDEFIRGALAPVVMEGMTREQVNAGLDELHVSREFRLWYNAEGDRPPVQFVRLFPPGGFWPGNQEGWINWVDISFVFGDGTHLSRTVLFRDGVRYVGSYPLNPPKRTPAAPFQALPSPPPPPLDPLQYSND